MPRVRLDIQDPGLRLTVRALLQADGHTPVDERPDVIVTDDIERAPLREGHAQTLVLASASQIRDAVAAMARGAHGYVFVPLQPGEVELMVRRAAGATPAVAEHVDRTLEEVETEHILDTLRRCKNNRSEAARVLGVGRNTLWRRLKQIQQRRKRD
jgi:DNA-binding NtrC family response regulator